MRSRGVWRAGGMGGRVGPRGDLDGVGLGCDGDLPPAGQRPDQDSGFRLRQPPALGLLRTVVPSTERVKITFTGFSALMMRNRMIIVTPLRPSPAPRVPAPRAAHLDDVQQRG